MSLDKKTFSTISPQEYDAMCEELNLTVAGEIHFAETQILLQNIQIPNSFKEQVRLLTRVNISKVEIFYYHQADE